MSWWPWLLPLLGYLLGSLSPAWMAGRAHGIDLREHGSRNLGATNAARVLGAKWFFIVFAADVAKGVLAVLAARLAIAQGAIPAGSTGATWLLLACAAGAVLGHSFTCFHGFKGGKAVATSLGVIAALVPLVAASAFSLWLVCWCAGWAVFRLKKTEAVGPASVLGAAAVPVAHLLLTPEPWSRSALPITVFMILLALLVIVRHRGNIARLLKRSAAPA